MPEIKHTFTGGKMNKDLDERFVRKGEYRDAMNIQVRTSDGDASGTAQNIQGNIEKGASYHASWMDGDTQQYVWTTTYDDDNVATGVTSSLSSISVNQTTKTTCVGSVADEKTDKAYFFFTTQDTTNDAMIYNTRRVFVDTIMEQHIDGTTVPVVVDKWAITGSMLDFLPVPYQQDAGGNAYEISESYNVNTGASFSNILIQDAALESGWSSLEVVDGSDFRVGMTMHGYLGTFCRNEHG